MPAKFNKKSFKKRRKGIFIKIPKLAGYKVNKFDSQCTFLESVYILTLEMTAK